MSRCAAGKTQKTPQRGARSRARLIAPVALLAGLGLIVELEQPSPAEAWVPLNCKMPSSTVKYALKTGNLNRPGSDGGSGYWFPTPIGEVCWAA